MTYFRIAGRLRSATTWRWRTTKLTALPAVWAHLQRYRWPEHTELRVFFASSVAGLDEILARANAGKPSASVPAEQVGGGQPLPRGKLAGYAAARRWADQQISTPSLLPPASRSSGAKPACISSIGGGWNWNWGLGAITIRPIASPGPASYHKHSPGYG